MYIKNKNFNQSKHFLEGKSITYIYLHQYI